MACNGKYDMLADSWQRQLHNAICLRAGTCTYYRIWYRPARTLGRHDSSRALVGGISATTFTRYLLARNRCLFFSFTRRQVHMHLASVLRSPLTCSPSSSVHYTTPTYSMENAGNREQTRPHSIIRPVLNRVPSLAHDMSPQPGPRNPAMMSISTVRIRVPACHALPCYFQEASIRVHRARRPLC